MAINYEYNDSESDGDIDYNNRFSVLANSSFDENCFKLLDSDIKVYILGLIANNLDSFIDIKNNTILFNSIIFFPHSNSMIIS